MALQVHDSAARWRTMLQELKQNEISTLATHWPDESYLEISFDEIQGWDPQFGEMLIEYPRSVLRAGTETLTALCRESGYDAEPMLRVIELPPDVKRYLRDIGSSDVEQLIAAEVIITKVSELKPRVYRASFRCTTCGHIMEVGQVNELELVEPLICAQDEGGCDRGRNQTRFELETDRSTLVNNQWLEIQELPEQVKSGSQPTRLRVLAEGDLAGKHHPGERARVNVIPFIRSERKGSQKTPMFDIYLSLVSSERKNIAFEEIRISEEELIEIREVAVRPDVDDLFVRSLAPSIIATSQIEGVKRSLIYQLMSGVARRYPDGTRTRGDIHILLMGDPGVAKSQLLSFMGKISPRGRFTTGGGTTAAGLTAAAVRDAFNDGRFSLEAGALVLADMGLCAVDEFDKMGREDRGAMHEAMEQQVINVNKGGVSATMPTRCAVLAAANPTSGRFDKTQTFMQQTELTPPILSRFDIIWVLTDDVNMARDTRIGQHIIRGKRRGIPEAIIESGQAVDPRQVERNLTYTTNASGDEILTVDFMQKYVAHAKKNYHPTATEEVERIIVDHYTETRNRASKEDEGRGGSIPLTARAIEATLRLAEARARLHLRAEVSQEDAMHAIAIDKHWRYELMGDEYDELSLQTGRSTRERSATKTVTAILNQILKGDRSEVETVEVYNAARDAGVNEDTVDRILQEMRTRGTLYSPRMDVWRFA